MSPSSRRAALAGGAMLLLLILGVLLYQRGGGDEAPTEAAASDGTTGEAAAPIRARGQDRSGPERGRGEPVILQDDDPRGSLRLEGQVIDEHDAPVAGARVVVSANPPRTAQTAEDGSFFVDALVGRPYVVVARHERGAAGPVTVRLTESSDPVILRLRAAAAVEVVVVDAERKLPIAGATVELRDVDVQRADTGADGTARITPVVAGGYSVLARAPGYARQHAWVRVPPGAGTPPRLSLELERGAAVSGRVVSPRGTPIAGARVMYSGASDWAQQADPRHDADVTGEDGTFRFEGLPAGSFRFVARHDRHAPASTEIITLDGQSERRGLEIRLEEGAVLRGRVVDGDGGPVSAAQVRVAVAGRGVIGGRPRQAFTDEAGGFRMDGLPRDAVEVIALGERGTSEVVEVDLGAPPHEQEQVLTIDVVGTIAGIVVTPSGEPIEGAQVSAFPDFGDRPAGRAVRRGDWRLRGLPSELSDAGGRFTLRGLAPGSYRLSATPPGSARRAMPWMRGGRGTDRDAPVAAVGATDVRLVLEPDGGLEGRVALPSGEAPALFTVSAGFGGGTPFGGGDGAFALNDLPAGEYTLTIRGAGFDPRKVERVKVEPGKMTDVGTITVTQGRRIAGRVLDANRRPVAGATVRGGIMVFGDGSSSSAPAAFGPMGDSTKEATTDEHGAFVLGGVGLGDRTLVAEEKSRGRSRAVLVQGGPDSVTNLELVLQPFGALEGRVVRGGKPVAGQRIGASSQTAPGVVYGVATGQDGRFRYDRLAPDVYKVSIVSGMPMMGMGFHSGVVEVASGQTATVELTLDEGAVTVAVTPKPTNAASLAFAMIHLIEGTVSPKNARELDLAAAQLTGYSSFAFSMGGRPASFRGVRPATYSICAVPYPNGLGGPQEVMAYGEDHGDTLPAFCRPLTVAPSPEEQAVELEVAVPDKA